MAIITLDKAKSDKAIKMKEGTLTDVGLHKTIYKKAFTPVSECKDLEKFEFDKEFYNEIINSNYSYSQSQCYDVCLQDKIIHVCDCYDLQYLAPCDKPKTKPCLNQTQVRCANLVYGDFTDDGDIKQECDPRCPLECESVELQTYVSSSSFPSVEYSNIIKHFNSVESHFGPNETLDQVKLSLNTLALNIYFNDLEFTHVEENEINDIVDLIANIGGTVGVLVGMSVLSFAEILEFLIEAGIIIYEINAKKSKNDGYLYDYRV